MSEKSFGRLVEICPQCHRGVDGTSARLVSDVCGHFKCRICLLQEISGCHKCASTSAKLTPPDPEPPKEPPPRKSVIISPLELKSEQQVIQQESLPKDILFPTDIVKRSTRNFFHFKRLINERYKNEGGGKEDKGCGTEVQAMADGRPDVDGLPGHIIYYCAVHRKTLTDEAAIEKHKKCDGKDSFFCKTCNKRFVNNYKLKAHELTHRPTSKFQCQVCSKTCKDYYALTTHKRKHTGEKAFSCSICSVKFKQLWSLKRHLAAHKGEKNYPCESCNYRFYTKPELKRHMISHSNAKTFACGTCNARFSYHRSLVRHASCHDRASSPLQCQHCCATFKRKDNLLRHEKNAHANE